MEHVEELLDFSEYTTELEQALEELSDFCAQILINDLREHTDEYFSENSQTRKRLLSRITSLLSTEIEKAIKSSAVSLIVENVEVWETYANSKISSDEGIIYSPVNYLDEDRGILVLSLVVSMPNRDSRIAFAVEISPKSLL